MSYHLALYDFASKQKYIYRTPKIKEISGASALLDGMYGKFIEELGKNGIVVKETKRNSTEFFSIRAFDGSADDGEVLYEGGGNLMVLYKSKEKYNAANEIMSKFVLENYPGLTMIVGGTEYTGDYNADKKELYTENRKRKNNFAVTDITGVTPFTQIDPMTFGPVVRKTGEYGSLLSLSGDRVSKLKAFKAYDLRNNRTGKLDENNGLLAVIYIDGNSMGKKLQDLTNKLPTPAKGESNYDDGVKIQREFSANTHKIFIENPMDSIMDTKCPFRQVIGGGDEINIICKAEDSLKIVMAYFAGLNDKNINTKGYTACAGIAVFHAGSPFTVAYDIAEECCENAKKTAKDKDPENPDNYFDFYYCHGGITADFETLRKDQSVTARPYRIDDVIAEVDSYAELLRASGRSNVKDLGAAVQQGAARYKFETVRINSHLDKKKISGNRTEFDGSEKEMKIVYDMSEFYDLWFAKKEDNKDEENTGN